MWMHDDQRRRIKCVRTKLWIRKERTISTHLATTWPLSFSQYSWRLCRHRRHHRRRCSSCAAHVICTLGFLFGTHVAFSACKGKQLQKYVTKQKNKNVFSNNWVVFLYCVALHIYFVRILAAVYGHIQYITLTSYVGKYLFLFILIFAL